jgi:hypothetical protein
MIEKSTYSPETLNFWDRIFNRYKKVFIEEREESWSLSSDGIRLTGSEFMRCCLIYHKVDRLTGAYTIVKEYTDGH